MERTGAKAGPARRSKASLRRKFVPPQHGAWAMLAVPYLAGLIATGFQWPHVPLLFAWLGGYLLSYYVFQAIKSRRLARYRDQLVLYAAIAGPLALVVVVVRPQVLYYAPVYAVLFAANAGYARMRRERALLNDVAAIVQSCVMVFVVAAVNGAGPAAAATTFGLCLLYFLGTAFYVKTMIRERGNPVYHRWSVSYHAVALAVAAWLSPWAAVLFGWLLLRAAVLPTRAMTPKQVGFIEIGNSVLLLVLVAVVG